MRWIAQLRVLLVLFLLFSFSQSQTQSINFRADDVCANPTHPDYRALEKIFNDLNGPDWKKKDGWLGCSVCEWEGITCSQGRVSEIVIENDSLVGTFDIGPGALPFLQKIDFSGNYIQALFFSVINPPENITYLDLSNNEIRTIPNGLNSLNTLKYIDLSTNEITSNISTYFGNLAEVEHLDLSNNSFVGNFPSSYGNFDRLRYLNLSNNALTGCIPSSYSNHCDIKNNVFLDNNCNLGMPSFSDWCGGTSCSLNLELTGPTSSCIGQEITIYAPEGYDKYEWDHTCDTGSGSRGQSASYSFVSTCPGTYSVTATNSKGCSITGSITVDEYVEPDRSTSVQFCEFGTASAGGQIFNSPGVYRVPQTTGQNCSYDLVVSVSMIPRPRRTVNLQICEGSSMTIHGRVYNEGGVFSQEVNNPSGCDSILTVNVEILPVYSSDVTLSVCPGNQAEHDGIMYSVGSTPRTYQAVNGCDSVVFIVVNELETYTSTVNLDVCSGLQVVHDGQPYGVGTFTRDYTAANGCDSIVTINVDELFPSYPTEEYTICNGQTINVNGTPYVGGVYYQDFTNSDGCASVLEIIVTETDPYEISEEFLMCDGEPIVYNDTRTFFSGGTYVLDLTDDQGCNYKSNITITEAESTESAVYLTRCDGENPIYYGGKPFYNSSGSLRIENNAGCDSLIRVYISNAESSEETITPEPVCYPETVVINDVTYAYTNTFEQQLTNAAGCDSTLYINVTVNHRDEGSINAYICPGGSITINNVTYDRPQSDRQYLTTVAGCDSILRIDIWESDLIVEENTVVLCGDETHFENGITYSETGQDEQMFTTSEGCDSMYRLFIEKYENTARTIMERLCTGDELEYNGEKIDRGGTYIQPLTNANGCDSILTIIVDEYAPSSAYVQRETCEGTPWRENGENLYENGLHEQILTNAVGCDSILTIDLLVKEHTSETYDLELCLGQSQTINGRLYDSPETDVQNLTNSAGCDSTLTIVVTVVEAVLGELRLDLCEGESETVNGEIFNETRTKEQFFTAASGCDSILTVIATVYEHTFGEMEASVCTGSSIEINNATYRAGGTEVQNLINSAGCDSTLTIYIEELSPSSSDNIFYMCEGDTKIINGEPYEYGGLFEQKYTNAVGCDSIFYIELVEYPDTESSEIHFICPGESVSVNAETYYDPGNYEQDFINARGCDSILFVEVRYSDPKDTVLYDFICEEGIYEWKGELYENPGEYKFDTTTTRGCDSIVYLSLGYLTGNDTTINRTICKGDFYQFGNRKLYYEGSYFDDIVIGGCKSPTTLNLTVLQPSEGYQPRHICEEDRIWINGKWVFEAGLYQEVIKSKAGCDSLLTIEVFVEEKKESRIDTFICKGNSIRIGPSTFDKAGYFTMTRKSSYGCDSIIKINIDYYDTIPDLFEYSVCEGDQISFEGKFYGPGTYSGTYFDGTCTQGYELEVKEVIALEVNHSIITCKEETEFLGKIYSATGQHLINEEIGECEVVKYLNVVKLEAGNRFNKLFICEGSSVKLGDEEVSEHGSYEIEECNQAQLVEVVPINGDTIFMSETIFPGEVIWIEGQAFNEVGIYEIVVGEPSGCASVVFLEIKIEACGGERTMVRNLCEGESFDFFGEDLTTTGEYKYDKNLGAPGCDSVIILSLTFNSVPPFEIDGDLVFCDGDMNTLSGPAGYLYEWSNGETGQSIEVNKSGTYELTVFTETGCSRSSVIEVSEVKFTGSLDIDRKNPKSCDVGDGSITVRAENPEHYLYSVDSGETWQEDFVFENLFAGNYKIMLADPTLTCFRSLSTNVELRNSSIPEIENITFTPYNTCTGEGGSITIETNSDKELEYSVDGGENWSSSHHFEDLSNGNYQIYVRPIGSSCVNDFTEPVEIGTIGSLAAELLVTRELSCEHSADGALLVQVSEGTGPYGYAWSHNQEEGKEAGDLDAGIYHVTLTDANGCMVELTQEIMNIDMGSAVSMFSDTLLCQGDTIIYDDLDSQFNYLIFKDDVFISQGMEFQIMDAGHYQVIAQREGDCLIDRDFLVEYPDQAETGMDFLISTLGLVNQEIIVVNVSDPMPTNSEWFFDTSVVDLHELDEYSQMLVFSDTGTFELTYAAEVNGCVSFLSKEIVIHVDSSALENYDDSRLTGPRLVDWSITPNPNVGEFLLTVELSEVATIYVGMYDLFGNRIGKEVLSDGKSYKEEFNFPNISAGVYSVVLSVEGNRYQKSILVVR